VVFQGRGHLEAGRAEIALDPDGVLLPVLGEQPHTAKVHSTLQTLPSFLVVAQRVQVTNSPLAILASANNYIKNFNYNKKFMLNYIIC